MQFHLITTLFERMIMKKLKLFLFSIGVGAAFTLAHASQDDPACYRACDEKYIACADTNLSAGACSKLFAMCNEACVFPDRGN
jgi:hypothetical protein